jgi:pimeloyl-ACP methyl ester carboxylesterase
MFFIKTLLLVLGSLWAAYLIVPSWFYDGVIALIRMSAGLRLKEAKVDGHIMPYLEGGKGPALVLLHGFGANKDHWLKVAPKLAKRFHLYIPDLAGFGEASRLTNASYGVESQLGRLQIFLEQIGEKEVDIGGNSMGGYLAIMLAHKIPSQVNSLWLLAPAGVSTAEPSDMFPSVSPPELSKADNPLVIETAEDFEALSRYCFHKIPMVPKKFRDVLLKRAIRDAEFNHKIFTELNLDRITIEDTIVELPMPALVVWGDHDRVLHFSGMDVLKTKLANGTFVLMPDIGHLPMIEASSESAADYISFRLKANK